jgi:hypothetical protein
MKIMQGLQSKGCMRFMQEGCMKFMHTRVHEIHAPKGNHPKGNHQRAVSVWELASLVPDGLENLVTLTARSRNQLNPVGDQQTACAEIGTASSPTASGSTRTGVALIDASGVDRLRNGGLEQESGSGRERTSRRAAANFPTISQTFWRSERLNTRLRWSHTTDVVLIAPRCAQPQERGI